jgi:hypothetical protein
MLTLILAASGAVLAQGTAALKGTALDPSGAVISGVSVEARNVATGVEEQTLSGPDGVYAFAGLAAGTYTLTASAAGFQTAVIVGVAIEEGRAREFDLRLKVGAVTETIEVTGALPFLCPTQSNPFPSRSEVKPLWDLPVYRHFSLVRDASGNWQLQLPAGGTPSPR